MELHKTPKLTEDEQITMNDLRREHPREFNQNNTKYLLNQLLDFIKKKHVFRISIMGRTRIGKSEVGSTIAFWFVKAFNKFHNHDKFQDIKSFIKHEKVNIGKLAFNTDYICENQMSYKERMTKKFKENKLMFGQIWQIDEEKESIGGLGSMSEEFEMTNINNITAKFCQNEIWIQPKRFETRNTPFGLKVIKQDFKNRYNWCHLYISDQDPAGGTFFKFMGWVCIPLHTNETFRAEYNDKKEDWIATELEGGSDNRAKLRSETADWIFNNYPEHFEMTESGKRFKLSKDKQLIYINRMIAKKEIKNFNEVEKEMIVQECQLIAMERVNDGRE